ncbi:5'-methylthioadenosine/adenosylhomocysteine nucleosidase [Paludifilum halophilum]|uniref:adenosylhomocysteine nucleosidase n=1 Tax=Paludifilum halophilum TaxID=1642702 RepID=A0A235B9U4_9BACL|nr:5'-methylthioadenosine/adenosylhomocysteine nucleosidase [Paludifilum halophilum]OYD09002.1 5'-methylthioadenosine/S-adenosylhomocysteine nucleosidase [Paludifilum halophilum]
MEKRIGLIGAMPEEIALFLEEMELETQEEIAGTTFFQGQWADATVVVCQSGVGKVNAAVCTQTMIRQFAVEAVLFTGVAGALDPSLDIGDIVISTACQQHDIDAGPLGYSPGVLPFQSVSVFKADPRWVRLAEAAAEKWTESQVITGKVLSGDQFIADPEQVRQLRETFDGACVEMEGAAVAHVCHLNGIPFVVIRSMSDRADHTADVNFTEFVAASARRSNAIVRAMLRQRGKDRE